MSSRFGPSSRLIWSLAGSGLGTTIAAPGNSGPWAAPGPPPWSPNSVTPVDLRDVEDVWLTVMATAVAGTTPSLTVSLNAFDDTGNAWPLAAAAAVTAAGIAGGKSVTVGKHGASAGSYVIFPSWGQVAWAITGAGASFTGVDIGLWAR
jgi:hypothetical protein